MPVPDDIKDILGVKKPAAPRSPWRRLIDGIIEGAVNSPLGAEPVARQMLKNKGRSAEEINKGERRLIEDLAAKRQAENEGLFADVDTLSPANIGKHAVDLVGNIIGGADPTYVIAPGRGPITRIASQAGINAGVDVVNQGVQIARDIRDEYDPLQTGISAAAGVGIQGTAEVARALRGKAPVDINTAKTIGNKFGTVTSTLRSAARNKKVGGAKNSHHLRGTAIDIARGKGVTHKQLERAYRRAGYEIIESLDEGDHSHFAFKFGAKPKKGQPVIEDFDFRPPEERADQSDNWDEIVKKHPEILDDADMIDAFREPFTAEELAARRRLGIPDEDVVLSKSEEDTPTLWWDDKANNGRGAWVDFDEYFDNVEKLKFNDPISENPPILDSSHEKFTPYVERPNAPANDMRSMNMSPEEVRNLEETMRVRMQEMEDEFGPDWDKPKDVLTPAERQEMDASAVRPDIEPTTPKGLGGGKSGDPANDVNVHSIADARQQKDLKDFHKSLMSSVSDRVRAAKELVAKVRAEGLLPFEIGTRFTTPKGRELGQGPWKVTGYFVDPKDPNRYGYRVERGSKDGDDYESSSMLVSDPKADAERINRGWEPFDRAADVTGWKKLGTVREADVAPPPNPPLPNDPDFPAPGTPGNRGGPYGGDDGGSPYDGLSPEDKILQGLRDARPASREQKKVYHEERSRRSGRLDKIQQEGRGEAGVHQARASLKGEMPKVDYESINQHFSQEDRDYLMNKIASTNALLPFEKQRAQDAVLKLLGKEGMRIPTAGEIELLQDVFSKDITEAIIGKQVGELSKGRVAGEILNMPRSWMSSGDISGIGRQAAMLVGDKEFWSAYPEAIKNAMSEGNYQKMLQEIKDNPNYKLAKQGGLAVRDTGSLNLHDREDFFMSNFAEHIPLEDKPVIGKAAKAYNESVGRMVRASDRAYGVLRKIRMDVFDRLIEAGREAGIDWEKSPHKVKVLSEFINSATGRGSLEVFGFNFESAAPLLNAMFFSPRLNMGRVRMMSPFFLYKMARADPFIAKTYGKTMGKFLGAQALILSLAVAGGATVETDPRSADGYKIKIGNTRLDTWGGFQQFARLFAQNITRETKTQKGEVKSLTSGKYGADTVWDVNERFITNKFAPIPGVIRDWWKGKDPVGDEFSAKTKAGELIMPMGFQQVLEALKEEGPTAAWTIIPSFLGIGVTTYEPKKPKKKSQIPDDVKELLGAK